MYCIAIDYIGTIVNRDGGRKTITLHDKNIYIFILSWVKIYVV